MLRAVARLREVRVGILDPRILVAVTELFGEAQVSVVVVFVRFNGAFGAVGIVFGNFIHNVHSRCGANLLPRPGSRRHSKLAQPFARLQRLVRLGIALDNMSQFRHAIILLPQFD